jgi:hypothetical protein
LIGVGGGGSSGGSAGDVLVSALGHHNISTQGVRSSGIYAQSVGGGGGSAATSGGAIAVSSASSQGGAAGDVSVTNQNDISTAGEYSRGIFAQSVGGGGGDGGDAGGMFAIASSGSAGKTGGDVDVTHSGAINTVGDHAVGLFVQSVGGSGGNGGGA